MKLILICAALIFSSSAAAQDALTIAQRVYDRDDGRDSWAEGEMILIESGGKERPRQLVIATKDFGEITKRYIRFTEPSAIDGTSFLSVEQHEDSDLQYLYLPSLRRVRRIASDQKDRSFVNTDFTFEDLERRKVERDNFKILRSEACLTGQCWVMERTPQDKDDSQYEKLHTWVDKTSYLVVKSHMFDKKGKHFKTFEARDVKRIDNIWTVMHSTMSDLSSGHKTISKTKSVRYNKGVPDEVFTEKYLEKKN